MTTSPEPVLDVQRILDALDRHHVEYLAVGGTAANVYGASRVTEDFDCIPERSDDNLARLALAMQELNARFRIEGLTDAEAQALPNKLDALALRQMELTQPQRRAGAQRRAPPMRSPVIPLNLDPPVGRGEVGRVSA